MRRLVRGAASLFGLAALAVGIPALLIAVVGWPLPHGLPTPDAVGSALADGWRPDERFVLGLLAILVWLLRAQLLRHVLSQFRIQLRVRRAAIAAGDDKLPEVAYASATRHGPAQRLAGWLIGGLMMATPLAPSAAMAAPSPPIPVVLVASQALDDPLAAPPTSPEPASTPALERSAPTYVVHTWAERRDCLSNIAERYLGDPFRWTEIRDLNAERVQADGRRLGDDPSSWVHPGWELVLPPDATGADVVPAQAPPPPTPAAETLAPSPAPAAPVTTAAPPTSTAPPTTTAAPSTTFAAGPTTTTTAAPAVGSNGAAPPAPAPPPLGPAPSASQSGPSGATSRGTGSVVSVNPWAMRAAMAAALGLPVFALAGWLARLRRGRVRQASQARPGREVVRPEPEVEPLELAARVIAADETEEWIDAALQALTAALSDMELGGVPELRCVRAGDMGLEVLLAEPFPTAPECWEAADGGYVWRLDPDIEIDELRRRGAAYAVLTPALVSLGASPEGPILADLEGFGALAVEGDIDRVRAFVRGAALELTSASWSEGVLLRVYGVDGFAGLEGLTASDGAGLVREVAGMTRLFAPGHETAGSMLAARAAAGVGGEPWYPIVVLVGPDADAAIVCELVELANPGSGVAVAGMLGPAEVEWRLIVGPDGAAVLKPLDMGMRMAGVADAPISQPMTAAAPPPLVGEVGASLPNFGDDAAVTASAVANGSGARDEGDPALWSAATEPAAGLVVDQAGLDETAIGLAVGAMVAVGEEDDIAAPIPLVPPPRTGRGRQRRERDCDVWVSILRPKPEIRGMTTSFRSRRRLIEVLAYLAIYGVDHPVQGEQLRTDCWPPKLTEDPPGSPKLREISLKSFHQGMSRLRAILGQGANGWHIPPAVDGAYVPGADVGCDWTLFRALAASGVASLARQDTARAIALYREALELVHGEPFSAVPGDAFVWAEAKHLVTDIRLAVAKVAHDLASLTRESDPTTALWASQQGLLLLPTQLGLFDQAMAASAELGDVAGLERTLAAKCWAHTQLDPDGGVPPETSDLYRHLLARAKQATPVQA